MSSLALVSGLDITHIEERGDSGPQTQVSCLPKAGWGIHCCAQASPPPSSNTKTLLRPLLRTSTDSQGLRCPLGPRIWETLKRERAGGWWLLSNS